MKNKWYVLLGIVLSLFSILIVSPIYIDGIKEGIKTGIENSKENVDQVVLDKNDQKSEENANYVFSKNDEKSNESETNTSKLNETKKEKQNTKSNETKEKSNKNKENVLPEENDLDKCIEYQITNGDLVDCVVNTIDNTITIKVQLDDEFDTVSIPENLENIVNLLQNQDLNKYKEIHYWAVINLKQGKKVVEEKVISFTIKQENYELITKNDLKFYEKKEFMSDLWLHPKLR